MKGLDNPAGPGALASELVCAELAVWFGLAIPDFAVVEISDLRIEMIDHGPMGKGPAFASRVVDGSAGEGVAGFLRRLSNPHDVAGLVLFDSWVRNGDRCPPDDALDPSPRYDNLFFRRSARSYELMALDHTHCFTDGELETLLDDAEIWSDDRTYGLFPEFRDLLSESAVRDAARRLRLIDAEVATEIVAAVPHQWGPSQAAREAWAALIVERGHLVADRLPGHLLGQAAFEI